MTLYKEVNGVKIPKGFSEETIREVLNYKAKPGDLFVVTFPKCGTTWMSHIVLLIIRKGQISEDPLDFFLGCPFLDKIGTEYIEKTKSNIMNTHIPYFAIPYSDDAKYIYVARNPKDCLVSYYYHAKLMSNGELTFDEVFEKFLEGSIGYGDYFDHLLEWYQHKNDKNVHFVTYEDLKKDIRTQILKIAKFIGEEYEKCILEDSQILENVIKYSSFEYMERSFNKIMEMFLNRDKIFGSGDLPAGFMHSMQHISSGIVRGERGPFLRKGIIGDWRNHFNEDQLRRFGAKIDEKTKNSDVMSLWKDI